MNLVGLFRGLAELAPVTPMPPNLFDRAYRRRRLRRITAALAAVVVIAFSVYGVRMVERPARQYAGSSAGIPDRVVDPPKWTNEFTSSPNGPAALVFWGRAVPAPPFGSGDLPMAVVGLTGDTYRVLYGTQPANALSPDGRRLLVPHHESQVSMAARHWRTDVVDLATGEVLGQIREAEPVAWTEDGRYALLVRPDRWDRPYAPVEVINHMTVIIVDATSLQPAWTVRVERPRPVEGEGSFHIALSPDASLLAVSTSQELRVYGRDGAIQWRQPIGDDLLAGPVAWRADGRLAIARRPAKKESFGNTEWRVEFVEAQTGRPIPDTAYPVVRDAFLVRVIAWRGDVAYAVVRSLDGSPRYAKFRASLVRLTPGEAAPEPVLVMPEGVDDLVVAAGYVDTIRPAGPPSFGISVRQATVIAVMAAVPVSVLGGVAVFLWWVLRRRTRLYPVPAAP